ncbi:MAG: hypothetical protein IKO28_06635 [Prevotella sp.]|nr:hypothetical protein [Prevotella sp.]MBR4651612.1 hypothetical protein [Prevotella sp.]
MNNEKDIELQDDFLNAVEDGTDYAGEATKTPNGNQSSVLGNKTIEDVIQREAKEEQDSSTFSISKTLGGVIIARFVQKQMGLVLLICAFIIVYISNRYVCQKKMVEIDRLETRLVEARYKATVCTSILTEKSRESNIMSMLKNYGDSTLAIPQDPPYLIRVEE